MARRFWVVTKKHTVSFGDYKVRAIRFQAQRPGVEAKGLESVACLGDKVHFRKYRDQKFKARVDHMGFLPVKTRYIESTVPTAHKAGRQ